jgi:CRP-like cAMP-binding protein
LFCHKLFLKDNDMHILSRLRQLPYFASATETQLAMLADPAVQRAFAPGEMIFLEGEPSAGLWIVIDGRVKAFKSSPDGQEYILNFFGPGDTFNDLAALDGQANPASTVAVTAVSSWVISSAVFASALQADHQLALAVLQGLVARTRHLVSRVEDLALRSVTARLARFLLTQVENSTLSHPAITRALIADHLAKTPESISRSLRLLEEKQAIHFNRHQIIISRLDILRELAQL